jgi:hypothetical protein
MKFEAVTFLPNGEIWDRDSYVTADQDSGLLKAFGPCVTFDNKKQVSEIETTIGTLKLDWVGSDQFGLGSSTWWLDNKIINTGISLYGNNKGDEYGILEANLKVWQDADFVKELCQGRVPFMEAFEIAERPLMISVNWAAIDAEKYKKIANFDLTLSAVFFEGMRAVLQVS